MSDVTITLTNEQIENLPTSSQFGDIFRAALEKSGHSQQYTIEDPANAVKLFSNILKFRDYYCISHEHDGTISIVGDEIGVKIHIHDTSITMHNSDSYPKTTLERMVKKYAKLCDNHVTLTLSREIATDYLRILVHKNAMYKYDRQVLELLVDILV